MAQLQELDLSPISAFGVTLLRFTLAGFWITHGGSKSATEGWRLREHSFSSRDFRLG
jgi:hypothetical protein